MLRIIQWLSTLSSRYLAESEVVTLLTIGAAVRESVGSDL